MPLQPPAPAIPGQDYYLVFSFTNYETGALTDPASLQLDLTYGSSVDLGAGDVAGPFTYSGATSPGSGVIWRTGTGQYAFLWNVPTSGFPPGVYTANWTSTYGPLGDTFLATENFPLNAGGPYSPVPSGDTGYWTGSLTYSPSWSSQPFVIPFGTTDANGVTWLWQRIEGWDSAPSVGAVIQRSGDHGGWAGPQFYGPRILTITAMASAPTQALRDQARAQLQQAVPVGDLAVLEYDEPIPKIAMVRRNDSSSVTETYLTLTDVGFTIPLVAPDPRKYAVQPQTVGLIVAPPVVNPLALPFAGPVSFPGNIPPSASAVTVINQGNFETRPVIQVSGPITSPVIVNGTTGQQITFTGLVLASTDVLLLDTDNRQASLNGLNYPADVSSAWWALSPGSTQVYLNGTTTGGASLTLTYSSAWL